MKDCRARLTSTEPSRDGFRPGRSRGGLGSPIGFIASLATADDSDHRSVELCRVCAPPTKAGESTSEQQVRAQWPSDTIVWVNNIITCPPLQYREFAWSQLLRPRLLPAPMHPWLRRAHIPKPFCLASDDDRSRSGSTSSLESLGPARGDYSNRCATARNQQLRKSCRSERQRGLPTILHWPDLQRAAGAAAA
jgi:hypothetical protein